MVSSDDIKGFVEGTLRPLSEGKKVKGEGKVSKREADRDELPDAFYSKEELEARGKGVAEVEVVEEVKIEKKAKVAKEKKPKETKVEKEKITKGKTEKQEIKKVENKGKAVKKDKVLVALEGIENDSVDLLFFDPFNRLGDVEVTFKSPADRDKYIGRVQDWLKEAYKKLNPKGGNMVIGASSFTLTSFGDAIFPTEDIKRMLSWYRETQRGELSLDRGYVPAVVPFLWGVRGRPWTFNLQGEEKFFDGEFKVDGGLGNDPMHTASQVVRRFTDEGDTVLELFGRNTVIKQAVEDEGRIYVSGFVTEKD